MGCGTQQGSPRHSQQLAITNPQCSILRLCRKRTATAASLSCVGVSKLKAAPDHSIAEVENQTVEIKNALAIANYLKTVVVEHFIVGFHSAGICEIHHVRHTRAAALAHPYPQAEVFTLLLSQS